MTIPRWRGMLPTLHFHLPRHSNTMNGISFSKPTYYIRPAALLAAVFFIAALPRLSAANAAAESWYAFNPGHAGSGEDVLSMADWLETPPGKHGRVIAKADA